MDRSDLLQLFAFGSRASHLRQLYQRELISLTFHKCKPFTVHLDSDRQNNFMP